MSTHIAEAVRLLRDAQLVETPEGGPIYGSDENAIAAAQVEATLAVAEHLRIANLAQGFDGV